MNKLLVCLAAILLSSGLLGAQNLSLSTNVLDYANLGTLNLSAEYAVGNHWSLGAGAKYNPYTYRQQSYILSARWWPWHSYSGWWLSGGVRYQEYNSGGYTKWVYDAAEHTSEGDRIGGGISAGYSYMLSRHFNLDVGAGVWAGREFYTVYSCPRCGRIIEKGAKTFLLPSNITLAISYIF